jgi:catechol 2,3-dioxygenase-like lactoylglutathione lyase family enzyme
MRWLLVPVALLAAAAAFLLPAQTAAPNATGVSFGHIHLMTADADAMKKVLVDLLGGTPETIGALNTVKTPGVFFIINANAKASGGSKGSAVDHIGFSVKSFADTKAKAMAAGLPFQEVTPNVQAFVTLPGDVILEIQEDTNLTTPAAFSHYHMNATDTNATREWYIKTFGGVEGERRKGLKGAMIPGGIVDFLAYGGAGKGGKAPPAPLAPTKGRVLDHIGFEVKGLKAFSDKLQADGIMFDRPYTEAKAKIGVDLAFITDPNGASVELTEGLAGK